MRAIHVVLFLSILAVCSAAVCAQTNGPRGAILRPNSAIQRPAYAELVARLRLSKKDADMRSYFPATATGTALAQIATLGFWGLRQDHPAEARQVALSLAVLRSSPEQALADLRSGLAKLPETYSQERQLLIQLASRLPASTSSRTSFLISEMSRQVPQQAAAGTSAFTVAVAADALLNVVQDGGQRDAALLAAAQAQPNSDLRRLIVSRYELADPVRAKALGARLGIAPR